MSEVPEPNPRELFDGWHKRIPASAMPKLLNLLGLLVKDQGGISLTIGGNLQNGNPVSQQVFVVNLRDADDLDDYYDHDFIELLDKLEPANV